MSDFNVKIPLAFLDSRKCEGGCAVVLTAIHIDPKTNLKVRVETKSFPEYFLPDHDAMTGATKWIADRDGKANLYFQINPTITAADKRPGNADILKMVSLQIDLDAREGANQEAEVERLAKLLWTHDPQPTRIIDSGGGVQGIWDLHTEDHVILDGTEATADEAARYSQNIEDFFNNGMANVADATADVSRMYRLPGTLNVPDQGKIDKGRVRRRSKVIGGSNKLYHLTEFKKAKPKADAPSPGNAVATKGTHVDWPNVPTNFAPDQGDLDAHNVPPYAQHALMMGDDDTLEDLNKKLADAGYGDTYYPSYSHLQLALANALKRSYTTEESAGILSNTKLKCNKHIKDMNAGARKRSVTRALSRAGFEDTHAAERAKWPDGLNKSNVPEQDYGNTRAAIADPDKLAIECRYDTFADRTLVAGHALGELTGDFSDRLVSKLREVIYDRFKFYPTAEYVREACLNLAGDNAFNSVVDEIDSFTWDGVERIDDFLHKYLGAADTAFNSAVGRKIFIAAVHRARHPGCKFDNILVLEAPEDVGKSLVTKDLAGHPDRHSEARILGLDGKTQQELLAGKWIVEIPELDGMKRAGVDAVKNFATTTHDNARPAYGRATVNRPRTCICIGTTNERTYLLSTTGNRRFWPVPVTRYDRESFLRDRAQLIAEATHYEAEGETLELSKDLKAEAAEVAKSRMVVDAWADILAERLGKETVVHSATLLTEYLSLSGKATKYDSQRLAVVMKSLGWTGPMTVRAGPENVPLQGYHRKGYVAPSQPNLPGVPS
jgi:hypothetical protein